jgi:WhiB family transcriptional regulator, redox-sensing transcriptional regulator
MYDDPPAPEEDPPAFRSIATLWPNWHSQANCLGINETTFFGSSVPTDRPPYTLTDIKNARSLCYGCPVFDICLRHALEEREEYGVWAATTRRERHLLFKLLDQEFMNIDEVISYVRRKHGV